MAEIDLKKIQTEVSPAGPGKHKWVLQAPGRPELATGTVTGTRAEALAAALEAEEKLIKKLGQKK